MDIGYNIKYMKVVERSTKNSLLLIVGAYISRPLVRNHYSASPWPRRLCAGNKFQNDTHIRVMDSGNKL